MSTGVKKFVEDSMDTQIIVKEERCLKHETCADGLQADASPNPNLSKIIHEKVEVESSNLCIESQQLCQKQQTLKDDPDDIKVEMKQPIAEEINIKDEILDGITSEKYCDKTCTTESNIQIQVEKKDFECYVCKYRCSKKGRLADHIQTHSGVKPFECKMCTYKCFKKSVLRRHMRVHTGEKPFKCNICKQKVADISQHMEMHAGPFACELCKNKYVYKGDLQVHMRIHTGKRLYECTTCKAKFTKQNSLKLHVLMHTGEKPYTCEICNNKYTDPSNLRRHMGIHTGDKPFGCTVCKTKCQTKSHLKEHMRTHTGEKPYACNICTKRFSMTGTLTKHMATHTKEKPFECDICKRRYRTKSSLALHIKKCYTKRKFVKLRKCNHAKMDSLIKEKVNVELEISSKFTPNSSENASNGKSIMTKITQEPLSSELQLEGENSDDTGKLVADYCDENVSEASSMVMEVSQSNVKINDTTLFNEEKEKLQLHLSKIVDNIRTPSELQSFKKLIAPITATVAAVGSVTEQK